MGQTNAIQYLNVDFKCSEGVESLSYGRCINQKRLDFDIHSTMQELYSEKKHEAHLPQYRPPHPHACTLDEPSLCVVLHGVSGFEIKKSYTCIWDKVHAYENMKSKLQGAC